ncbi:kelch motif domain-containing protein, putative [Eimeria maxima]|uniref:Kelch motif domain-containing protein, putative n=1 Tax=Eimeria maxima TaxID=5804 RepID=U6MHH9_EIMMA|nr:kelch motif domain-containing protein, putative [Eimeria maxima]CDJ61924.1 kelch motif domain-containing protein, putative [Eimeria maxima]
MGRDAACLPRRGAAAGAAAAAAVLLLLGGSIPSPIPITTPTTSSSSSSSNGGGVVLCALASEVADPSYGASSGFPSGGSGLSDQLSQIFSSVGPFVSQLLSGGSGDGVEGVGDSGGGGGGPGGALGALYEMGRRAAGALSTSLASDEARESMWVPLHEQIGVARDMLGLPGDDAQGVRSAARLLLAAQLPIARFAAEREACDDEEADNRALKIVNEYPTTKKMLQDYMEQKPDRNIRAAPADLLRLHGAMKEHLRAFRAAAANNILPVSILGALDSLSTEAAALVTGYLATVSRYLVFKDRFKKNKRGLSFFARHVLPRLLQLFALQLDACRHLWRFLSFVAPHETSISPAAFKPSLPPAGAAAAAAAATAAANAAAASATAASTAAAAANSASSAYPSSYPTPPALTIHDAETGGALRTLAQNLGFAVPSVPHAAARGFGRRLLARVQVHIGALHALAQGCLAATSLSFQREYAEAEDRVELGEAPAAAFLSLKDKSEQLGPQTEQQQTAEKPKQSEGKPRKKNTHRLRALNRKPPASAAAAAPAAAEAPVAEVANDIMQQQQLTSDDESATPIADAAADATTDAAATAATVSDSSATTEGPTDESDRRL